MYKPINPEIVLKLLAVNDFFLIFVVVGFLSSITVFAVFSITNDFNVLQPIFFFSSYAVCFYMTYPFIFDALECDVFLGSIVVQLFPDVPFSANDIITVGVINDTLIYVKTHNICYFIWYYDTTDWAKEEFFRVKDILLEYGAFKINSDFIFEKVISLFNKDWRK